MMEKSLISRAYSLPAAYRYDRTPAADQSGRRRRSDLSRWSLLIGVIISIAGCSDSKELATFPTTVKVRDSDGQPLARVRVSFRSVEHQITARGVADDEGVCQMTTYAPGDGAVAGRHQVAIGPPAMIGDPDDVQPNIRIPRRVSSYDGSKLEGTVTDSDEPNELTFIVPVK